MTGINSVPNVSASAVNFKQETEEKAPVKKTLVAQEELSSDKTEFSTKTEKPAPPKISKIRLMFNRLTDDQISQINASRQLPENAKFVMNAYGSFAICNNFFNLRAGTRQLPEGFEVKKTVLGFATVLPKGMESVMIKK